MKETKVALEAKLEEELSELITKTRYRKLNKGCLPRCLMQYVHGSGPKQHDSDSESDDDDEEFE